MLISVVLLLATGCMQNRERVIDNPAFDNSNTDVLQISKIALTDTATVLYVDAYSRPGYWIRIASDAVLKGAGDRAYKLLGSRDFELDTKVFMPQSGNVPFVLFFEPVDKSEKNVDFIEGDNQGDFRIGNIRLYPVKQPATTIRCALKGEVIDRPQSSRLILLKEGEDARTAKVTYIPIRDGKFEYTLYSEHEEAYELIFYEEHLNSAWRPISFIVVQGEINFTLHPDNEWENNTVAGGVLNREFQTMKKEIKDKIDSSYDSLNTEQESLMEKSKYYTAEATVLMKQIDALKMDNPERESLVQQYLKLCDAGKNLTPEAKKLEEEDRAIQREKVAMDLTYAKENPTIVGYSLLMSNVRIAIEQTKSDVAPMLEIYHSIYRDKYPNHPYSALIESYVNAASVKVGNPYIDVTATDADGNEVKLSDLITGKVALIHLWASWCGPCIRHGRTMMPIYEMYKDRGFTVVGISREQNKESMIATVQKEKYPWINLLELNDRHSIWTKYGIGNAGGGDFLVDDKGVLLAVNTTPEDVESILKNLLQ
ncbi:MAG: TlpA family protein disulfide reductase [Bacteroidales bacterium]|jgi:peroxiredoxin|nr:TlpA family protein disulfide reductase [Bacteroidales bacterium]